MFYLPLAFDHHVLTSSSLALWPPSRGPHHVFTLALYSTCSSRDPLAFEKNKSSLTNVCWWKSTECKSGPLSSHSSHRGSRMRSWRLAKGRLLNPSSFFRSFRSVFDPLQTARLQGQRGYQSSVIPVFAGIDDRTVFFALFSKLLHVCTVRWRMPRILRKQDSADLCCSDPGWTAG